MNTTQVILGQMTDLDDTVQHRDFEADNAVPFPLQAVQSRLEIVHTITDDMSRDPDAMELAVLFHNTFDESISVKRVKEAQEIAEQRTEDDDFNHVNRSVFIEEIVAAYGRDYAFENSSFRTQYDAIKWYSQIGLNKFGGLLVDTVGRHLVKLFDTTATKLRNAKQQLASAFTGQSLNQDRPSGTTDVFPTDDDDDSNESDGPGIEL